MATKQISNKVKRLAKQIYSGQVSTRNLPKSMIKENQNNLNKIIDTHVSEKHTLLKEKLKDNVKRFSVAKTYQVVKQMQSNIKDDDGNLIKFKDFVNYVDDTNSLYNETYSETEGNTAVANAQINNQWQQIQDDKEYLPLLVYRTVGDDLVDDECDVYDGFVASVDDEIWNSIMPTNHFNCRCIVEQVSDSQYSPTTDREDIEISADSIPKEFNINVGKEQVIFPNSHPYFAGVPKKTFEDN